MLKQQPLCVQWATRDRDFGGDIGIAIGIAMVVELVSRPNPSRVLLRTLEGFNHGIQEADEMERGGQEGAGDAVGTGKRPGRNSTKSCLVMGSSMLADLEREWKGKKAACN